MSLTERRADRPEAAPPPAPAATPRGFRPASRRRARIAAGAVLAAVGIGGNVLLYTSLDDAVEVVQVTNNIRAGQQVTSADLRVVEVDVDSSVPVVPASRIDSIVGQYALVYIAAGSLMVDVLVQPEPLVTPGRAVVAIELEPTRVPIGVRERSRVALIAVASDGTPEIQVEGRVIALIDADADGDTAMSFEVDSAAAAALAAADDVRIVLLEPGDDPAQPTSDPAAPATAAPATTPVTATPAGDGAAAPTTRPAPTTTVVRATTTVAATPAPTAPAPAPTAAPGTTGAAP